MKIINFKKLEPPFYSKAGFDETHSFDIEIPTISGPIIWVGWLIRTHQKGKNLRLQGPILNIRGKWKPAIVFQGKEELIPVLIRKMLKEDYGIDIPLPAPKPPKTALDAPKIDDLKKDDPNPKVWKVKAKTDPNRFLDRR